MSVFSSSAAQSIANRVQGDKVAARSNEKKAKPNGPTPGRGEDELDLSVENALTGGAVRNLKGNADEETHDDRAQQDHYTPPKDAQEPRRAHIDVQG